MHRQSKLKLRLYTHSLFFCVKVRMNRWSLMEACDSQLPVRQRLANWLQNFLTKCIRVSLLGLLKCSLVISELIPPGLCKFELRCRGYFTFEAESEEGLLQWSLTVRQRILEEWKR